MKEKLFINKRLPYIKLPKEKLNLFITWYNIDLKSLSEIPEVFDEGYIELDTSDYILIKTPNIFEMGNCSEKYANLISLRKSISDVYSKITIYFKIENNQILKTVGYYNDGKIAFRLTTLLAQEKDIVSKIKQFISVQYPDKDINIDEKKDEYRSKDIDDRLVLDLHYKSYNSVEEMNLAQQEFNHKLADNCASLVVAAIWYLATNKSEKYLVNNTKTNEVPYNENNKHYKQNKHHYRNITTPIYYLVDTKPVTIERLIKKRNGWTISHSFQVRGHYRHYRDGKTIFIKSYEKGKELDNFQNTILKLNPQG